MLPVPVAAAPQMLRKVLGLLHRVADVGPGRQPRELLLRFVGQALEVANKLLHGGLGDALAAGEGLELLVGLLDAVPAGCSVEVFGGGLGLGLVWCGLVWFLVEAFSGI